MRRLALSLLLAILAAAVLFPAPAPGFARDCRAWAHYPNVLISSARNMSCGAAKFDMRRYKRPIYRRFRTPGGFLCTRVAGMALSGQWRCVKGTRAYRFNFGD